MSFIAPVPFKTVRRSLNERIVAVASQSDATKFRNACERAGFQARHKKGKHGCQSWFVRVWKAAA